MWTIIIIYNICILYLILYVLYIILYIYSKVYKQYIYNNEPSVTPYNVWLLLLLLLLRSFKPSWAREPHNQEPYSAHRYPSIYRIAQGIYIWPIRLCLIVQKVFYRFIFFNFLFFRIFIDLFFSGLLPQTRICFFYFALHNSVYTYIIIDRHSATIFQSDFASAVIVMPSLLTMIAYITIILIIQYMYI